MVLASRPVISAMRLAARPVGAASETFSPRRSNSANIPRKVVVLPVPGPPVRINMRLCTASAMARRCTGS